MSSYAHVLAASAVVLALTARTLAGGITSPPLPRIEWDVATLRLVAEGGNYGRMVRLDDGRVACAYDRDRRMWIRHGDERGKIWGEPVPVDAEPDCWLTNAFLLPLRDGTLLYFWDERPLAAVRYEHRRAPPGVLTRPFRIRVARSADRGRSWSTPQTVHSAGVAFQEGCWEPAAVQRGSGEVEVYFADESRFSKTSEQEIARVRSGDAGATWTPAERVSFRAGHRDGMPAPLVLAGGRGVVVAVEDDGLSGDRFRPAIIAAEGADRTRKNVVGGDSPDRWAALADPLPRSWYAGAPFLVQLPSGPTLLSFQESPDGSLAHCRMAVCVGDAGARGFTNKSYPVPQDPGANQLWNSLFVRDAATVTAVLGTTIAGRRGIWAVDGRVVVSTQ